MRVNGAPAAGRGVVVAVVMMGTMTMRAGGFVQKKGQSS
jgi:hypothetical protein